MDNAFPARIIVSGLAKVEAWAVTATECSESWRWFALRAERPAAAGPTMQRHGSANPWPAGVSGS